MKISILVAALIVGASGALAEGDATKGEKVFRKCKACHDVGDGAKNKVGPALTGIVGAPAGVNETFKYSNAFKAAAEDGLVWDDENLHAYLTKPRDFIKGNKMSFAGLKKESDRDDVIAYLATFQ